MNTKTGSELIAAERERQITQEGWTPEHDDQHHHGQLARAAFVYEVAAGMVEKGASTVRIEGALLSSWPWQREWFKGPQTVKYDGQAGARGLSDESATAGIRQVTPEERRQEAIRALEKSGALYLAERDRLQRRVDKIAAEIDRLQRKQQ